ncbi:pilin [Nocardia nova]|uniref:pilin n=1 Tax=Nocardia nova TaxID=37330 RepID=UPI0033F1BFF1
MRMTTPSPFTPSPTKSESRHRRRAARVAATVFVAGAVVVVVGAAASPADAAPALAAAASLNEVCDRVRNWLIAILATLATTFLTVGGARYLLSGGDASEVERAKSAVRAAMIGYCLAILAPVFVAVLKSLVGG